MSDKKVLDKEIKRQDPYYALYDDKAQEIFNLIKPQLLKDDEILNYFYIAKVNAIMDDNDNQDKLLTYYKYLVGDYILNNPKEDKTQLKASLYEQYKEDLKNEYLNICLFEYDTMTYQESEDLLYTLTKLFYLRDKYKDTTLTDNALKYLNTINHYEALNPHYEGNLEDIQDEQEKTTMYKKQTNYLKTHIEYMDLGKLIRNYYNDFSFNKDKLGKTVERYLIDYFYLSDYYFMLSANLMKQDEIVENIKKHFKSSIDEAKSYYDIRDIINDFLEDDAKQLNINITLSEQEQKIVKDKIENAKQILNQFNYKYMDYANFNTLTYLLAFNDETREFLKDPNTNLSLENPQPIKEDTTTPVKEVKKPKKPKKQTKEQFKEAILVPYGKKLDDNKNWAIVDTDKTNNMIMNIREAIGKKVDTKTDITKRKIKELESIAKPTKAQLQQLSDYKATLKEQELTRDNLISELEELKADRDLLTKQMQDISDGNEFKKRNKTLKQINKSIKEKEDILKENGLNFQLDLNGNMTYTQENKKTHEQVKLILNANYDIQNFNPMGRKFLEYIPNIPNIMDLLNDGSIVLDINDFCDFYGYSNPRRVRTQLFNTLKEMQNERYEYHIKDKKGNMIDASLILVGDVVSVLYNGKMTVKVQLGDQYKTNIKNALQNGYIAHVNRDIFKLSNYKVNDKRQYMAQRLYLYFVKLARTEAKKDLMTGATYEKALKIETLINYLIELNLISYNPNRYLDTVVKPLLETLQEGQEVLNLFEVETDAFSYYDDVIGTLNNGANISDKIPTFENHLINIKLVNNDTTDLESHLKAKETFKKSINKNKKKKSN